MSVLIIASSVVASAAASAASNAVHTSTRAHKVAPTECLESNPECGHGDPGVGLFIGAGFFLMVGAVAWVMSK